jgi:DNA-binding MarR family transcriptional regulator
MNSYSIMLAKTKTHRLTSAVIESVLYPHGLSINEWLVLGALIGDKSVTSGDLAYELGISKPLIARIVSQLIDADMIHMARDTKDSRIKKIQVTPKAKMHMETLEPEIRDALKNWLKDIDPSHVDIYIDVVLKLAGK